LLLHRLPLDQSEHCSCSSDLACYQTDDLPRLSLRPWIAAILFAEVAAVALLPLILFNVSAAPTHHDIVRLLACATASAAAWLLVAHRQGLYESSRIASGRATLSDVLATVALGLGIVLLIAFAANSDIAASRLRLLALAGGLAAWVLAARIVWHACLRAVLRRGYCLSRALVLAGSAAASRDVAVSVENASNGGIRVAASAPIPGTHDSPPFAWVEDMVHRKLVDRIVIADFEHVSGACAAVMPWLMHLLVDVVLVPDSKALYAPSLRLTRIDCAPSPGVTGQPLRRAATAAKRTADLAVALAALVMTAPLLLAISLAIRLDSPGPVLFRQQRIGMNGVVFRMWKFRTMYADMADEAAVQQTCRNDPRVTRIGNLLRRSSLDELPQLVNVLLGDMSIVGPRPHALGMTVAGLPPHVVVGEYTQRDRMKPGITGWAQVNGSRGPVETEQKLRHRVELDCHYIETWSLGMDVWIMLRTAILLAFDRHAY
jgi:polysaccharide biosynthesis protein PslA